MSRELPKRRLQFLLVLWLLTGFTLTLSAESDILKQADALYDSGNYAEGIELLNHAVPSVADDCELAAMYWRITKFLLAEPVRLRGMGKKVENDAVFEEGKYFADKAVELYPSADAYYWRASNYGLWAEQHYNLHSLSMIGKMKEDLLKALELDPYYADAWFVLGKLHLMLPGWPISFGNVQTAVSLARRAVYLKEGDLFDIAYYTSLAEILWKRNWDAEKRNRELTRMVSKYERADCEFDRQSYFEGALGLEYSPVYTRKTLREMADREEAEIITGWLIDRYEAISKPGAKERMDYKELTVLLKTTFGK
jgi:tetratricopeptide (TPR) repeat protein